MTPIAIMPQHIAVRLREWQIFQSEPRSDLYCAFLPEDTHARKLIDSLYEKNVLTIEELRNGTRISTTSWVGRITIGYVQITVDPKITGLPLLNLLRYAYGLQNLDLHGTADYDLAACSFLDLLIHQLAAEVEELLRRGLCREYIRRDTDLALPRGRIDIQQYVRNAASVTTTLPCTFHPRTEDTHLNRILLAGLRLADTMTTDPMLRFALRNRCRLFETEISTVHLDSRTLQHACRSMSRLTTAYEPALKLIGLLLAATGISLEGDEQTTNVQGFLFDMNRFFQALLSRFLSENLPGYTVRDECVLCGMMAYDPNYNPQHRKAPAPRPDFVVLRDRVTMAVLDAKYRDLWETPLPRDMLYQLAIYALSQEERRTAAILYPTLAENAKEAHVIINDMVDSRRTGRVVIRPVNMNTLSDLVTGTRNARERQAFAHKMAFGAAI